MKTVMAQYLNDVVSLTIMLLMTMALIAGEADATIHDSARGENDFAAATVSASLDAILRSTTFHAEFAIKLDLNRIAVIGAEELAMDAMQKAIEFRLDIHD